MAGYDGARDVSISRIRDKEDEELIYGRGRQSNKQMNKSLRDASEFFYTHNINATL